MPAAERPGFEEPTPLVAPGGRVDRTALLAHYERLAESDADEADVTVRFELARDLEKRLDRYLVDRIPFLSRTSLQRLIRAGAVTVNDRAPKPSTRLRRGDVVVAAIPPPPSKELPEEEIPLAILHEDAELLVLDKQPDLIVHPARGHQSGTLINGLAWHFRHRTSGALSSVGEEHARPGVVHRLDRFTSGVMVVAKSDVAHWKLGRQFEQRTTEKRYLAVVHGRVETNADVIDLPIGPHPSEKTRYAVRWDALGKQAVTIVRVREVYESFTLLELELKTGRTHQIRVHLSHLGHPIAGDDYYGGRHLEVGDVAGPAGTVDRSPRDPLLRRQALHATLLGFVHPGSGAAVEFLAPLHADMRDLVALLRTGPVERPRVAGVRVDLDAAIGD